MKTFTVRTIITRAWETLVSQQNFYIKNMVVFGLISVIASFLVDKDHPHMVDTFLQIISSVSLWYATIVMIKGTLRVKSGGQITDDVYNFSTQTLALLIFSYIVVALGTIAGLILLIIPGVIFAIRTMFTAYVIIDENATVYQAIQKSILITKGHFWGLMRLFLVITLFSIILMILLPFGIGLLVFAPLTVTMIVESYLVMKHNSSADNTLADA